MGVSQVYSTLVHCSAFVIKRSVLCLLCLQRYIALEDSQDGEKKELQCRLVTLESHTRQLELKTKNYADQSKSVTLYLPRTRTQARNSVSSIDSLQVL